MTKELSWREQIATIGKSTFELRQMLKLGFIDKNEMASSALDFAEFESIYDLKIAN